MNTNDIRNLVDNAENQAELDEAVEAVTGELAGLLAALHRAGLENPYVTGEPLTALLGRVGRAVRSTAEAGA